MMLSTSRDNGRYGVSWSNIWQANKTYLSIRGIPKLQQPADSFDVRLFTVNAVKKVKHQENSLGVISAVPVSLPQ